jgi:hypothetical protein
MGQVFNDQRRKFRGYWIYFYPDEFFPPNPKPLNLLHIHFFDENGEIRVYLSQEKYLNIDEKWGMVPKHERNKHDILNKLENELREISREK